LLGGPLGGAVGGVVGSGIGSLIGSLFGPHINPANQPDINNTQTFGQDIANLQGKAAANGQNFTEDSQVMSALGGLNMLDFIKEWITQKGGVGLSQDQISEFSAYGVGGGANGTGLGNLTNGNLDFGPAAGTNFAAFYQQASDAITAITASIQQTAAAPGAQASRGSQSFAWQNVNAQSPVNVNQVLNFGDVNGMSPSDLQPITDAASQAWTALRFAQTRQFSVSSIGS
jgi:hypothetical protein